MRNLRNIRYSIWRSPPEHQERSISATAWDNSDDSYICAYGPSENDSLIELVRVKKLKGSHQHNLITSWDAPSPNPDVPCDKILSLYYFSDSLTACLVLAGGDIVVVREEPLPGEDRIEIVGSVDVGITAARWSPDEELLAITTKANTLVFMSRSFEGIMDVAMTPEDLKASKHVSVGWGKKETQFQGRGAKALRDPTMPEKVDEGVLSPFDDNEVTITWRGDGAFVAISAVEGGSRRLIRVYSREGVLDSASEPVDGLEGALSWRPAGNVIAGIQRFTDRVDVVFFERNGLRHGQFSLRLTGDELLKSQKIVLSWNNDSTVLAVILNNEVQLWTMGNYYWYLKQHIYRLDAPSSESSFVWHSEKPLLLLNVDRDSATKAEYAFSIAKGSTTPPYDLGSVAVIDGKTIKLTPFRSANVPPPMALYDVSSEKDVLDVAFNYNSSLIAVLYHGGADVYSWNVNSSSSSAPVLKGQISFESSADHMYRAISFNAREEIAIICQDNEDNVVLRLVEPDMPTGSLRQKSSDNLTLTSAILLDQYDTSEGSQAFIQDEAGHLLPLTPGAHNLDQCVFPLGLPWAQVVLRDHEGIAFGLSTNGHLYANKRLLVKNCTSFLVTPAHLIFTTTTHLLKFVHITDVEALDIPDDDPEADERCRSIERGARLVTAMPTALSLVLQMPRGNLETLWPRAMVLAGIRSLIEDKYYKKAFLHCRTQRVDMNILYDHRPDQFMANIPLFIDQVKKITYIDLFLSSLRDEDVTQTMYKETKISLQIKAAGLHTNGINGGQQLVVPTPSKVNRICDAFLDVLKTRTTTNLQNIITANVCKTPPALDDGLLVVARLMKEHESLADKAVEHICFLADANRLYDNALGLYNINLALLVAQQSQKDPREYLPFLQKLQEMPELRRKFAIDDYLGRHTKALSHLHELSSIDFSEFDTYTAKHALYKSALSIYRYQPTRLDAIMGLYASYLESKSQFREAGIAYEYLHQYDSATACYQKAGPLCWREALYCASQQHPPLSPAGFADLATALADSLYEAKDYTACATIHLDYLSSIPSAARILCKGYHFAAALQLAAKHNASELLIPNDGIIDIGLTDALASSTELLAECKAQLQAQVPRIRELRIKAQNDPLAFYEGEVNEDIPDDISVAASSRLSTGASLFTRYTGRHSAGTAATGVSRQTSKNRRREERKRARGKKGSVYEEEYLVASVGRLVERVEIVREEIERLVVGLLRRRMRERALAMETMLGDVVSMCKEAVKEVFPDGTAKSEETVSNDFHPTGGDAVLADSIEAAGKTKVAPHIGLFEKLSLLGD